MLPGDLQYLQEWKRTAETDWLSEKEQTAQQDHEFQKQNFKLSDKMKSIYEGWVGKVGGGLSFKRWLFNKLFSFSRLNTRSIHSSTYN